THVAQPPRFKTGLRARKAIELLIAALRTDRDHQVAADGQLVDENLGNFGCSGGHDDAVERRLLFPAEATVAVLRDDMVAAKRGKPLLGLFQEWFMPLDRVDAARQARQHRRLIA